MEPDFHLISLCKNVGKADNEMGTRTQNISSYCSDSLVRPLPHPSLQRYYKITATAFFSSSLPLKPFPQTILLNQGSLLNHPSGQHFADMLAIIRNLLFLCVATSYLVIATDPALPFGQWGQTSLNVCE